MKLVYPNARYMESYRDAFDEYKNHKIDTYLFTDVNETDVIKYNIKKTKMHTKSHTFLNLS